MKCSQELQDVVEYLSNGKPSGYFFKPGTGIDINSKAETAIAKLLYSGALKNINDSMPLQTFKKYLLANGVSKAEMALTLGEAISDKIPHVKKQRLIAAGFSDEEIADIGLSELDRLSVTPADLQSKVTINKITSRLEEDYDNAHILKDFGNPRLNAVAAFRSRNAKSPDTRHFDESYLGWSRMHTDTIQGEDVLVLNEFQSDWAQGAYKDTFPIKYSDFKKLAIVHAIDTAYQNKLSKVIIPIDRSGDLHGTEAITKMYSEVNKNILPKIRSELERAGLKIKSKLVRKTDGNEDYVELILPELNTGRKVRWDMLGVIGALGLTEEYETIKEQ